jgi:hypothetical protein
MSDHRRCNELLPWYVNGTLAADQVQEIEEHLGECEACRRELERCRALAALYEDVEDLAPAAHPARIARLWARAEETPPRPSRSPWRWIALGQAAAIVVLLALALRELPEEPVAGPAEPAPVFRTLGDAELEVPRLTAPTFRVVFAPDTPEETMRRILRSLEAEIVAGPSPLGVYTVSVPRSDEMADWSALVVETLRREPDVLLAERVHDPSSAP